MAWVIPALQCVLICVAVFLYIKGLDWLDTWMEKHNENDLW